MFDDRADGDDGLSGTGGSDDEQSPTVTGAVRDAFRCEGGAVFGGDESSLGASKDVRPGVGPLTMRGARSAIAAGPAALIDDDLAYVSPSGFDLAAVRAPALLVHGTADRVVPSSHSRWLADRLGAGQLRLHEGEGHISVLRHAEDLAGVDLRSERSGVGPVSQAIRKRRDPGRSRV